MNADLVARLRALDTPSVSDALDTLGIEGAVGGVTAQSVTKRVAGRAVTVRLVLANELPAAVPGAPKRHLCTAAVVASGPDDVIVISHPGGPMAGWGGLLTRSASLRGVEATIIDGPARDIDESRELGYPVYAPATTPITARGRIGELGWNEPITFAGVSVSPGDLVLADGSGVVFVPAEYAEDVIAKAEAMFAKEARMAADLEAGLPVTEVMGKTYEELAGKGASA